MERTANSAVGFSSLVLVTITDQVNRSNCSNFRRRYFSGVNIRCYLSTGNKLFYLDNS